MTLQTSPEQVTTTICQWTFSISQYDFEGYTCAPVAFASYHAGNVQFLEPAAHVAEAIATSCRNGFFCSVGRGIKAPAVVLNRQHKSVASDHERDGKFSCI